MNRAPRGRPGRSGRATCWLAPLVLVATGCTAGGPLARWRLAGDHVIARAPSDEEVGDQRGLLARTFTPERGPRTIDPAVVTAGTASDRSRPRSAPPDDKTQAEVQSALQLFDEGKLDQAERELSRIERWKVRATLPKVGSGVPFKDMDTRALVGGSLLSNTKGGEEATDLKRTQAPWSETVLFYLAETQYKQGKLVAARDTYAKLATSFPGSQYLDKVAEREYAIATTWLTAVDAEAESEKREQWGDRFNGYLPLVDVSGHALQTLEHVRHHDPTGPLADDAAMRIGDFHFANGDFEDAAVYYDQLIEEYPKSPLLKTAHLKSVEAKLKAYSGPEYDTEGLEQARQLIRRAEVLFPERQASTSSFLDESLTKINDQEAEITFRRGEFYRKTGYPGAAELCYGEVKARWPKSPWAEQASAQMEVLAKMPRKQVLPSKIMTAPGASDPYNQGMSSGSMGASPGGMMGMPMGGTGP